MTDDLLTRMRSASSLGAAIKALDEGADRIELLAGLLREARTAVESWTPDESNATESEMRELNRWYELRDNIDVALGERHE